MCPSAPAMPVRDMRICLIGGESTGKTTVARDVQRILGGTVVEECVRAFTERVGRTPRREEQAELMEEQRQAAARVTGTVICDPAPVQVAIYSILYFDDDSLLAAGLSDAMSYDAIIWCRPDIEWVAEPGVRDGSEFRDRADQLIGERVIPALLAAGRPVIEVAGALREPRNLADSLVESLTDRGSTRT